MTKATEISAYNRGLADLAVIAAASANVLRGRLTEAPTRYAFAIEALDALVEASAVLVLPTPPDGREPAAAVLPKQSPAPMSPPATVAAG